MIMFQFAGNIQDVISQLDSIGLRDLILPFILLFTIIFATLDKVKIFKEKKINSIIALVISLTVVVPHVLGQYPQGSDVIQIINNALPGISLWVVMVVSFLILIGMFYPDNIPILGVLYRNWIAVGALAVVGYIFGASAGWWGDTTGIPFLADPRTQALIVVIAIFAILIGFITGNDETPEQRQARRAQDVGIEKTMRDLLHPPKTP